MIKQKNDKVRVMVPQQLTSVLPSLVLFPEAVIFLEQLFQGYEIM